MERRERLERMEKELLPLREVRINREKAQADVLRALEHPRDVLLEYMNSETQVEVRDRQQLQALREVYDEDTIRIFETIEKFRKEPELLLAQGIVSNNPTGQLAQDVQLQYLSNQALTEQVQETADTQVHREVERIRTEHEHRQEQEIRRRDVEQRSVRKLELQHRENETSIDESLLEELLNVNRQRINSETHMQEQQVHERTQVEETVTNRVNERSLREQRELDELVGTTVRQQLRGMSEQVYRKLEKRMDTERRRRGM
jgi:hypothetical protein